MNRTTIMHPIEGIAEIVLPGKNYMHRKQDCICSPDQAYCVRSTLKHTILMLKNQT